MLQLELSVNDIFEHLVGFVLVEFLIVYLEDLHWLLLLLSQLHCTFFLLACVGLIVVQEHCEVLYPRYLFCDVQSLSHHP